MNISPIGVRNFSTLAKNNNSVKYTSPVSFSGKDNSHSNGGNITLPMATVLGLLTLASVGIGGCSKDGGSNPITPVIPPIEQVDSTKITPIQKEIVNVWKALKILPTGVGKINSNQDVKSIKSMSYYDTHFKYQYDKTLHDEDSTKATYYVVNTTEIGRAHV